MNNNELNRIVDLIWTTLNSIDNQGLNKNEQIELIKPIIIECASSSRETGRRQILNHLQNEIKGLRAVASCTQ
tara:strand:- start:359 stop:577 length:219 start_codon:yes stop_codon:yes gene_type:complete